ncbi:MAG: CarD family transcriptional regulator [Tissierellales bacterium]|jgi:CarD family transcriptional regulator|nr:CarD family transcriptional regulator [Tissierellales bacterium]HCX04569.1 CarD family transcriptional regulator [Clostridiales bacterium]
MYRLGDKIVYPMHGAGVIESVEEKEVLGEKKKYFIIKMPVNEMKLMIPVDNVENIGVRKIISNSEVEEVFDILREDSSLNKMNWNKRYRANMDRMKSGDIFEVARIVRSLTYRDQEKGLSTGEKKMLSNAKQILISELILAEDSSSEEIESRIDKIISEN